MNEIKIFKQNCGDDRIFILILSFLISGLFFQLTLNMLQFCDNFDKGMGIMCVFCYTFIIYTLYYIKKWEQYA